ncbi:MAG TPA: alpha/beta hydrolase-fold protein [Flavitalea sp.]|nr:alpha/beta hydrolase-fold protein [Flavitalea sp.]
MKSLLNHAIMLCLSLSFATQATAQNQEVTMPGSQVFQFTSAINGHEYDLQLSLPASYKDSVGKRYPVVYLLDGQWSYPTVTGLVGGLQYDGELPEIILVGIAFRKDYETSRAMDFSPTKVKDDPNTGGGPLFLQVLKNEIVGRVDSMYRTDKNMDALCGGSYGGLFVLYAMFNEPELFSRYHVGSPYLNFDNGMIMKLEQKFRKSHSQLNARIFFCSGEFEEIYYHKSDLSSFVEQIQRSNYSGAEIRRYTVPEMGHASSGPYASQRALQFFYGRPVANLTSTVLDQYTGRYKSSMDTTLMTQKDNNLFLQVSPGMKLKLIAENSDHFYSKGLSGRLTMDKNNKGKVTGYTVVVPAMGTMSYTKME